MNVIALLYFVLCISIYLADTGKIKKRNGQKEVEKGNKRQRVIKKKGEEGMTVMEKKKKKQKKLTEEEITELVTLRNEFNQFRKKIHYMWGSSSMRSKSVVLFDARLPSETTKCGSQVVTGWTEDLDVYYPAGSSALSTQSVFNPSTGVFEPPLYGYYHICASFRFKKSGNSNDVAIMKNGAVIAAFGNADTRDWRSTGTCTLMILSPRDEVTLKHQSGSKSDCIEETDWSYSRFSGFLVHDYGSQLSTEGSSPKESPATLKDAEETLKEMRKELDTWDNNDEVTNFNAYLPAKTKCGPQTITGWSSTNTATKNHNSINVFTGSDGRFTANTNGWYRICASFRFKRGGSSAEVTLRENGVIVAAFGSALQYDWRSTGTCIIVQMPVGGYMELWLESTGASDCIEETGWYYARFTGHLIAHSDRSDRDTLTLTDGETLSLWINELKDKMQQIKVRVAMFDSTLSGYQTRCGQQTVKGWINNQRRAFTYNNSKVIDHTDSYGGSSGIYTVPIAGKYMICAYFRFRNTGYSSDVTLLKDGAVVAAFGDAIQEDWRSTGTCLVLNVEKGSKLSLKHQSGGSNDCIEETGWFYSRFMGYLIQASD